MLRTENRESMTNPIQVRTFRSSRRRGGFTLVEVCLALGIMAFTMIPLIGVMALGLGQVRNNIDNNQAVNICQQVFVAAQQQSFSQLATTSGYKSYFTADGDPVPAGNPNIVYTANVTCTINSVTAPTPPLVTLAIKILKTPGGVTGTGNPIASFVGTVSCPDISGYNAGTN